MGIGGRNLDLTGAVEQQRPPALCKAKVGKGNSSQGRRLEEEKGGTMVSPSTGDQNYGGQVTKKDTDEGLEGERERVHAAPWKNPQQSRGGSRMTKVKYP